MDTGLYTLTLMAFSTSFSFAMANAPVNADGEMSWEFRLIAMAVGGISSLFALHFSKPNSHKEALYRFAAGCVVAFCMTGTVLSLMHFTISIDTVMAAGLMWGAVGWSVLGGLVAWGNRGGPLAWLAQLVQGKQNINFTPEQLEKLQQPTIVKEIKPTDKE